MLREEKQLLYEDILPLLKKAQADASFADVLSWAKKKESSPLTLNGLSGSQKALIVSLLAAAESRGAFILVPDDLSARSMLADFSAFLPAERVLRLRSRPLTFIDARAVSVEGEQQRLAALSGVLCGHYDIVIASAQAALSCLMTPEVFRSFSVTLKRGSRIEPDELMHRLVRLGYHAEDAVEEAGTFARRGDIFDIGIADAFGSGIRGIRLSFFDVEIDDVREFVAETQRSSESLGDEFVTIPPARELLLPEGREKAKLVQEILDAGREAEKNALARGADRDLAEKLCRIAKSDAERIENGLIPSAIDRWLPLILKEPSTLLDYGEAAGLRLVVDEPQRFVTRLSAARADLTQQFVTLLEQGHVLPLSSESSANVATITRAIGQAKGALALAELPGSGLSGGSTLALPGHAAERYHGREDDLAKVLRRHLDCGGAAVLFAGSSARSTRLQEFVSKAELTGVTIAERSLSTGFLWPGAGIFLLGEDDIFGSARKKTRRYAAGIKIDLLSDLSPGEMVVHEEYGIGRYDGLERLETSSGVRDYLKITYADGTLHIPMESLDQIQKYIRTGEGEPKLTRMGGADWQNKKRRAREAIRRLAVNLVELYARRSAVEGHAFLPDTIWQNEFEERFPYEETEDQLRVLAEIKSDMESPRVMDRLLCGDVGFGKTEICFRAMFKCVMDGKQAALLSPTTVLTEQHFRTLSERLGDFPVNVRSLSRFETKERRKNTIAGLQNGEVDIVIGTHRLLSKDVRFKDLGLLIIDEEQRFGVDHKERLKELYPAVDVLSLTATPIPRTLHMSLSGIRDISLLEEGPDNRRPIQTYVMMFDEEILSEAITREIGRGGQIFYLYNNTRKIEKKADWWQQKLPGIRIGIAHGQMGERSLEDAIADFLNQEYDMLVCTTIIESGIDMPNVNTLIVEDANRFGLSQLYQLRGRVGRSERQAYAYITYRADLALSEVAQKRLTAIRDFTALGSGFRIALKDLEVRGAGNLLGGEQSGHMEAIGYDMYTRMLDEAIKELSGRQLPKKKTALVDLDTDAYLGRDYIRDDGVRLDLYRKIAAIETLADYRDVIDELVDRFGDIPRPAQSLIDVAYIRSFAERRGLSTIRNEGDDILLYLADSEVDLKSFSVWMDEKKYRGRLHFNAGHRPHLLFRKAAADKRKTVSRIRKLFLLADEAEAATKN